MDRHGRRRHGLVWAPSAAVNGYQANQVGTSRPGNSLPRRDRPTSALPLLRVHSAHSRHSACHCVALLLAQLCCTTAIASPLFAASVRSLLHAVTLRPLALSTPSYRRVCGCFPPAKVPPSRPLRLCVVTALPTLPLTVPATCRPGERVHRHRTLVSAAILIRNRPVAARPAAALSAL